MQIRELKFEDILTVSEMDKSCFKESWSYGAFVDCFERDNCEMLVAEEDGEILGYGCLTLAAESADLENIAVAEEYRRGGIGSAILEKLESDAAARGVKEIWLEVRVSNSPAMAMYLKFGYIGKYARSRYYSDGEDALVMAKNLLQTGER